MARKQERKYDYITPKKVYRMNTICKSSYSKSFIVLFISLLVFPDTCGYFYAKSYRPSSFKFFTTNFQILWKSFASSFPEPLKTSCKLTEQYCYSLIFKKINQIIWKFSQFFEKNLASSILRTKRIFVNRDEYEHYL